MTVSVDGIDAIPRPTADAADSSASAKTVPSRPSRSTLIHASGPSSALAVEADARGTAEAAVMTTADAHRAARIQVELVSFISCVGVHGGRRRAHIIL